jgi:hypothetical protein
MVEGTFFVYVWGAVCDQAFSFFVCLLLDVYLRHPSGDTKEDLDMSLV